MSRRSYHEEARERLLRFWECDDEAGAPIGCVTTTYTFSAPFFEEECLGRFIGVDTNPREDGWAYLIEREEKLSQVFSAVLVDCRHVAPYRSLRWHLLPVRVPGGGVMHAKVTILVWEHRIRVLVGSANLTEPAYRRNLENLGVLDFGPGSEVPLELLHEVIDFLDRLRGLAPGSDGDTTTGPQAALSRFFAEVRRRAGEWESTGWVRGQPSVHFVALRPGETHLFDRLRKIFPSRTGPQEVRVLSPFFDEGEGARRTVDALVDTMGNRGKRRIEFFAAGRELNDAARTIELELPSCLREPWKPRVTHRFSFVRGIDDSGEVRSLHAKSFWLQRGERGLYVVGSSNFTAPGTSVAGIRANVEANLAYVLPSTGTSFSHRCKAAYPNAERIDPDEREVHFLQSFDRTQDGEDSALLPEAFGLALFRPEGEGGILRMSIGEAAPSGFRVNSEKGDALLSSAAWMDAGCPAEIERAWREPKPPSHLRVTWPNSEDGDREAIWIVNVTDSSHLPPPEELRSLDLDELIAILTSARPLHEAVREVLRRRAGRGNTRPEMEIDPHRKVDTRNFLLRRMRRVAAGLEGLRQRLERPVWHLEALRWRLQGPVGPLALARKLAEQEPGSAPFMLAEVALTVHRADWSRAETSVGVDAVRAEIDRVLADLEKLARRTPAPRNLAGYVREAFAEIRA